MVVQAEAHLVQQEIRSDRLRPEECCGAPAVVLKQIFDLRRPVRRDRDFDAGARRPSQPPQKWSGAVAAGDLRERLLIVGPGESASSVEQPMAGSVADAASHGAGRQYSLGKADRAERRRRKVRGAANGEAEGIYSHRQWLKGGKCCIRFGAEENPVWRHVIVATLESGEEAPGLVPAIDRLKQIVRAANAGASRPVRISPGDAKMAAGIEPVPVIGRTSERNCRRLCHDGVVGCGAGG